MTTEEHSQSILFFYTLTPDAENRSGPGYDSYIGTLLETVVSHKAGNCLPHIYSHYWNDSVWFRPGCYLVRTH